MSPYDPAATSESPTHPDAPRAGGETPAIDLEATLQRLDEIERRNIDPHAARVHYLSQVDLRWLLESIRAALPALLDRPAPSEETQVVPMPDLGKRGERVLRPDECEALTVEQRLAAIEQNRATWIHRDTDTRTQIAIAQDLTATHLPWLVSSLRAALLARHRDGERR